MIDQTSPAAQITQMLSSPTSQSDQDIMGRDDFLRVLITQLRYQDPMEPLGQTEMIAQLTQFNMLDELRDMNSTMAGGIQQDLDNVTLLAALQQAMINGQSVSLIGREVEAEYSGLTVGEAEAPAYTLEVPAGASNVTISITDANGTVVRTQDLGPESGTVEYRPELTGLSDGEYEITAEALTADGSTITVPIHLSGTVTAVRFSENGTVLEVDGQEISLADVISIAQASN